MSDASARQVTEESSGRGDGGAGTRPLTLAVLTSRRAPGLDHLLRASTRPRAGFRVGVVVTSDPVRAELDAVASHDVPLVIHGVKDFCRARGSEISDHGTRRAYDRATRTLIAPYRPDLVLLCGYLLVVRAPLLDAYPGRVLNLHDADLTRRDARGAPLYPGLHATLDALRAGETETRSTLHVATEEVDAGPPLLVSGPFAVHPLVEDTRSRGAEDVLRAYAYAHREWMMSIAWGPLMIRAAELFASGKIGSIDGRPVVDGHLGPVTVAGSGRPSPRPAAATAWRRGEREVVDSLRPGESASGAEGSPKEPAVGEQAAAGRAGS